MKHTHQNQLSEQIRFELKYGNYNKKQLIAAANDLLAALDSIDTAKSLMTDAIFNLEGKTNEGRA